METKVNVLSNSEHELEVTLGYDEIKEDIDKAYLEERKSISLPGFRKGKVPISMLKKMYGEAIEFRASEKIANDYFWKVVDQDGLKPLSTPAMTDIDFQRGEKLSFKVKYEVVPELELKDYTGLEIKTPAFKVTDEILEKELKMLLKTRSSYEEADVIEDENFRITIDLQRVDQDGNPLEGQSSNDMVIDLSEEKVNEELPKNAKGKKVGETFEFSFTDTHYHGEEQHTEEYKYVATVKKIEKMVLPEATDELIKELTHNRAETLEDYKKQLAEQYENYYKSQSDNIYTNGLINKLIENNPFEVPPVYLRTVLDRMVEQEKENAKKQNLSPIPDEEYRKFLADRAEYTAKWHIISENLIRLENIKVEDEDLQKLAEEESAKIGLPAEKLIEYYKSTNRAAQLLDQKVFDFLKEKNPPVEYDPAEESEEKETKKKTTGKNSAKKNTKKADGSEKPKKTTGKRTTKKAAEGEEGVKKTTRKRTVKKKDDKEEGTEKKTAAKKTTANKTTKKDKKEDSE